ncbi:heterokaryon incompatibility protein-domain-containing protein [Xylaria curta]|nr:heterokaryon incompatibility protein-domain-containing protein [Xylaria curta]
MLLDGPGHDSVDFPVKPNLYHALKQLRDPEKKVWLWVDALCINQNDTNPETGEKPRQINLMPDIYSKAHSVVIWLGEAQTTDSQVVRFVESIRQTPDIGSVIAKLRDERTEVLRLVEFGKFIRRSWFSRRWVIQEVVLAKSCMIQFGKSQIHWADFSIAMENFNQLCHELQLSKNRSIMSQLEPDPAILYPEATTACILVRLVDTALLRSTLNRASNRKWNLESLVSKCRMFHSTNKHDTIYSLISIARDMYDDNIKHRLGIQYQASLEQVYAEFVKYCVDTSDSLDIICRHWAHVNSPLPISWVRSVPNSQLDATKSMHSNSFVGEPDAASSWYSASSDLKAKIKLGSSPLYTPRELTMISSGIVLGRVNNVSGKMINGTITSSCWNILGWTNGAPNPDFNKVCRSLVADRDAEGWGVPKSYIQAFDLTMKNLPPASPVCVPDLINNKSQPRFVTTYLQRVRDTIWDRKFFSVIECPEAKMKRPLVKKAIGLTSGDVRIGDLVCILFGCSVPLVIRPHPNHLDLSLQVHGKLIDECFIYGMMDGEAFRLEPDERLEDISREVYLA